MSIYSAVKTNYFSGVVTITSTDSTPYAQIQASMGSIQYQVKELYMVASTGSQILQPITQKEYTLQKVEGVSRVNKPDWAFIVPWDGPDGKQYVIDDKTNYVFEATETGEIGAWTGFMRV